MYTEKPYRGASVDIKQRQAKNIFADNNIFVFSLHNCWTASTCKMNTSNVNVDENILNFSHFTAKKLWSMRQITCQ